MRAVTLRHADRANQCTNLCTSTGCQRDPQASTYVHASTSSSSSCLHVPSHPHYPFLILFLIVLLIILSSSFKPTESINLRTVGGYATPIWVRYRDPCIVTRRVTTADLHAKQTHQFTSKHGQQIAWIATRPSKCLYITQERIGKLRSITDVTCRTAGAHA